MTLKYVYAQIIGLKLNLISIRNVPTPIIINRMILSACFSLFLYFVKIFKQFEVHKQLQ